MKTERLLIALIRIGAGNEEPPADQRCSDEEGEYGPYSMDIDPAGWASLGGTQERNDIEPDNPGDLAVLSYTFLG